MSFNREILCRHLTCLLALLASWAVSLTDVAAETAGTVGAVNPSATGTPPNESARTLAIGNSVVRNERLQTSSTGTLQVMLSDRTTMNLGPNSNIVIDQYVYNPTSGVGTLQATVKSGLMRFVGGQVSHGGGATVNTPVATIGIRGNMVIIQYNPSCGWQITSLAAGVITIRNNVSEQQITRPGYTVCVASANQPIAPPSRANPKDIQLAFLVTLSQSGQHGGAIRLPSDQLASRRGIGARVLPSNSGSPLDLILPFTIQQSFGRNSAQSRFPGRTVQPTGDAPDDPGRTVPTTGEPPGPGA